MKVDTQKLNVLEIISSLKPTGGAEHFAVNFSNFILDKVNLTVVILHKDLNKDFMESLFSHDIEPTILDKKNHFDLKTIRQLRKIIVKNNIDCIHTENNCLLTTYFAIKSMKKKPIVFHTIHNPANIEAGSFVSSIFQKYIFKKSYFVPIAISKRMKKSADSFYHRKNTECIYVGIDTDKFDYSKKLCDRNSDCVVVARLEKQKNHLFLIDVFCEVHKVFPGFEANIIGEGSLFGTIQNYIKDKNANGFVHLLGRCSSVVSLLSNSKIMCLGSTFEGNPACLLEGMSSGCVIVSTNVGGIPDIISENINGFLFDVGDVQGFSRKIIDILGNISEYEIIRNNNIENIGNYSMDKITNEYVNTFNKYLKDKKPIMAATSNKRK